VRIHHLALRTLDLARLERFYVDVFDLEVLRRDGVRSIWLDLGGVILMLERSESGEPTIDPGSKELLCFGIAPGDRDGLLSRLAAASVTVEGRTRSTLYFRDPDGRRIGASAYPEEL
jgi:catechol 2,3-dioxygenase-like lactoylglutathione lyase family enzyme